jgi:hypothetical protein
MVKPKFIFFWFFMTISCSSIKSDFNNLSYKSLILSERDSNFKELLSEEEFREDILLLRYSLERAYGARGTISDEIFEIVDRELSGLTFISKPIDICKKIGEVISKFPDSHLKAKYRGTFCYKKQSQKVNVGKNLNDTDNPWKGIKAKDGIYTIAISQFTPGKWPGFFEFADEALTKAKAIILDLRGNGGGDDSIGFELAEKLAGQKIETPIAPDVRRNNPETLTVWNNYLTVLKKDSNNESMKKQLDIYISDNKKNMDKVLNGQLEEFTTSPIKNTGWKYDKTKGCKGSIFILQDNECGSSCESTIDFFEYFPNVTKVGFNTKGMIHFGNIGIVVLPNSSIQINIPTKANKYKDDRFIEFTGIKPNIVLGDGEDAYDYVVHHLKNNR